jgi:hypothetical protein
MLPQHRRAFKQAYGRQQNKVVLVQTETKTQVVAVAPHRVRRSIVKVLIVNINVARPVCNVLFGEGHRPIHRFAMGGMVAITGVAVAKFFGHVHNPFVAGAADFVGYGLHGLGLMPIFEHVAARFEASRQHAD